MNYFSGVVLILLFLLLNPGMASANKVALVIGNSTYQEGSSLKNPVNDAKDMNGVLRKLGFDVVLLENANLSEMRHAISQFGDLSRSADVSLFYYAGHGQQVKGRNYLIPVDASISKEADIVSESLDVGSGLLSQMEQKNGKVNIVMLDSCRNNPFASKYRSGHKGLASIDAPTGTIISYATAPGQVTSDGSGRNSPYTSALTEAMQVPGLMIEQVLKSVAHRVKNVTDGKQMPWYSSSLVSDFLFIGDSTSNNTYLAAFSDSKGKLFVEVSPLEANIRILNIVPPYFYGMELVPGRYRIEVSSSECETQVFDKYLREGDNVLNVSLECKDNNQPVYSFDTNKVRWSGSELSYDGKEIASTNYLRQLVVTPSLSRFASLTTIVEHVPSGVWWADGYHDFFVGFANGKRINSFRIPYYSVHSGPFGTSRRGCSIDEIDWISNDTLYLSLIPNGSETCDLLPKAKQKGSREYRGIVPGRFELVFDYMNRIERMVRLD